MLDRPGTLEGAKLGDHRMFSCHAVEPTEGGKKKGAHTCAPVVVLIRRSVEDEDGQEIISSRQRAR